MVRSLLLAAAIFCSGASLAQTAVPPTGSQDDFQQPADKAHAADVQHDVEQGKKLVIQVEKEEKLSKNKDWQARVDRIGQQIAKIANHNQVVATWGDKRLSPFHYTFKVLQGEDINAFSLPGGHVYVFEGLMKFVESDDELAGVLGHEVAHAAFRHVATLEHDMNKSLITQIPILIAAILTRSGELVNASQLYQMSEQSGWSVRAEKAADYGGFQYLVKSQYNPVAMLTFMERLAQKERFLGPLERNLGILQTHPISRDRADSMIQNLRAYNIPIKRSKASPAYRVTLKEGTDGAVVALFNGRRIYTFGGNEAHERAQLAQTRLNDFFDSVPELYDVTLQGDEILWKGDSLLTVEPSDAQVDKIAPDELARKTLSAIKQTLYSLAYRVWDGF